MDFEKNKINIAATQYTTSTQSLDIYVSGCKSPHCDGCHNSELWDFDIGGILNDNYIDDIIKKIKEFKTLIDNFFVYGGEPLDQNINTLVYFLKRIKEECDIKIYLFTKYDLKYIPDNIKEICDYLKCGPYLKDLKSDDYISHGIKLATTNQIIYKKGIDY